MEQSFGARLQLALCQLHLTEADITRRQFMQTSAGAVGAHSSLLGLLTKLGLGNFVNDIAATKKSEYDEDTIQDTIIDILSQEDENDVPPEIVRGYIARQAIVNPKYVVDLLTGDDPYNLDEYVGGAMPNLIDGAIKRLGGVPAAIKLLHSTCGELGDSFLSSLGSLQSLSKMAADVLGTFNIEAARSNPSLARILLRKIGADKSGADKLVDTIRKKRQPRAPIERITPRQDDYLYGASMHQPFEARLRQSLAVIPFGASAPQARRY